MSLQEYLLAEIECNAMLRTPAEVLAEIEEHVPGRASRSIREVPGIFGAEATSALRGVGAP